MRARLPVLAAAAAMVVSLPSIASAKRAVAEEPAIDYAGQAQILFRVVACGGSAAIPDDLPKKTIESNCKEMKRVYARFQRGWADVAAPFFASIRPSPLPDKVVYPFGGGDLLFALVTYPDAVEYTSISLELAGDATVIDGMSRADFQLGLADASWMITRLAGVEYSFTEHMAFMQKSKLPVQLCMALAALAAEGYEPTSLRYFRVEDDGSLHYYTQAEIQTALAERKKGDDAIPAVFANAELAFRKAGDAQAPTKIYRSIAYNLDDKHFGGSGLEKHLAAKGPVVAMVKAASYLLWRDDFTAIRTYLLDHVEFMVSDSTGILPTASQAAGFELTAYGHFKGSLLHTDQKKNADMIALWKKLPARDLAFRFGYPDYEKKSGHLLVARRIKK
jgi:hypothetical protein